MTAEASTAGVTARLTVDLSALAANYQTLCAATAPARCGAVVKANAYGLGIEPIVSALCSSGCDTFFVATLNEGLEVRTVTADATVFVFAGADAHNAAELAAADLIPMLNTSAQLDAWRGVGGPAAVHLDTGMGRLGFSWDELSPERFQGLDVVLLATHLACADQPEHPLNALQVERFGAVAAHFPGVATSIGNSAGLLSGSPTCGDLARPGIALYGGNPYTARPNSMRPVVTLEAKILQLRDVAPGMTVGYGADYSAAQHSLVATVGAGYADGYVRRAADKGEVWIGGQRAPIVGRVSMDLITVDVTNLTPAPDVGAWVELLGSHIGLDELAGWADTIGYEVLTGLGHRAARRYVS